MGECPVGGNCLCPLFFPEFSVDEGNGCVVVGRGCCEKYGSACCAHEVDTFAGQYDVDGGVGVGIGSQRFCWLCHSPYFKKYRWRFTSSTHCLFTSTECNFHDLDGFAG